MKIYFFDLLIATSPNLLVFSLVELLSLYMTYAFFFFFLEISKSILLKQIRLEYNIQITR